MLDLEATLAEARRRPDRRRQAEDLARPRPRALGRQRHHVRRAADRDRPAPEVAAALQAEGAAPAHRPDDDLRHPRPDRGADLRRQGGRDARRRGRADRHAGRAVRAAAPHLRRPLHRLAGHERAALRGRERRRRASPAMPVADRESAGAARSTAQRLEIGVRPEFVTLRRRRASRCGSSRSATPAATASSRRGTATAASSCWSSEGVAVPADGAARPLRSGAHPALCRRLAGGVSRP